MSVTFSRALALDLPSPDVGTLVSCKVTGIVGIQACNDAQQGGLAAAVGPHHRHLLA